MLEEIDNSVDCFEKGKCNVWISFLVCVYKYFFLIIWENLVEREENIFYWVKWALILRELCRVSGFN